MSLRRGGTDRCFTAACVNDETDTGVPQKPWTLPPCIRRNGDATRRDL